MEDDVELSDDDLIVRDVLQANASLFAPHNLELTRITLAGSPQTGHFPLFYFYNAYLHLNLVLSFAMRSDRSSGHFTALIVNAENRKLNVEDYLRFRARTAHLPAFGFSQGPVDLRKFTDAFVRMFAELMSTDLKSILEGQRFDDTPIDWQGNK